MIARIAEELAGGCLGAALLIFCWYGIRSLLRHAKKFDRDDETATK